MKKNIDWLFDKKKGPDIKKIVEDINTEDFNISDVFKIKDSVILNNNLLWNSFHATFTDNINYITNAISVYKSWWKLNKKQLSILNKINTIHQDAIHTTKELIDDLFKEFLPQNFKTENWISYIKKYGNLPFLDENLYKKNSLSIQWNNIARDLYLLSVNYIISYYRWLENISENFTQSLTEKTTIDKKIQVEIQNILSSLKYNLDNPQIFIQLLYVMNSSVDKTIFTTIEQNIKVWRVKTFSSAIKKLLKSPKYRDQFLKEWILWDQIWLLCEFKDKKQLEDIVKKLYEEFEKWNNISKCNDRWIIEKKHDNKDTVKWINPFANIWIIKDNISLWEISLRYKNNNIIKDIVKTYKNNKNLQYFFKNLITKVDFLNHEIYKLSQDIKILREIIVDIWTLPKQTNYESRTKKYLEKKIKNMKSNITNHIQKIIKENNLNINIKDSLDQNIIKYTIYEMLEEKIWLVIHDLAWEQVLSNIKYIKLYKKLKDTEKRDYLKRISLKFKHQIEYDKDKKWKNGLTNYSDNIKNIYKKYKNIYNKTFKTAIFYKQVTKYKNTSSDTIKNQLETNEKLFKSFNKNKKND